MTERDLNSLKELATPAPRADAKVRAMSIGMASFDAAQKEWPESFQVPTQGTPEPERPTNVTSLKKERSWMRFTPRAYALIAASIIAMVAAAPFLLRAFDVRPVQVPQVAQVPAVQTSAKVALADQAAKQAPSAAPTAPVTVLPVSEQSAWIKLCETVDGKSVCLVHHEQIDGNTGMIIVSVALREVANQKHLKVMVPLGFDTQSGISLQLDQGDIIKMPQVNLCHPVGCTYEMVADQVLVDRLKSATSLRLVVRTPPTFEVAAFTVPLAGFTAALAGPPEDAQAYYESQRTKMHYPPQTAERQEQLYKEYIAKKQANTNAKPQVLAGVVSQGNSGCGNAGTSSPTCTMEQPADSAPTKALAEAARKKAVAEIVRKQMAEAKVAADAARANGRRDTDAPKVAELSDKSPKLVELPLLGPVIAGAPSVATMQVGRDGSIAPPAAGAAPATVPGMQLVVPAAPAPAKIPAEQQFTGWSAAPAAAPPIDALEAARQRQAEDSGRKQQLEAAQQVLKLTQQDLRDLSQLWPKGLTQQKREAALQREVDRLSAFVGGCQSGQISVGGTCTLHGPQAESRDKFDAPPPNATKSTLTEPVSTFSVDVDTASYALARRHLTAGQLPPRASVRVEEMINYFKYDYRRPESATAPFEPQITVTANPWNPNTKLVHIGLKGYEIKAAERPRANIVLLVDVSGSMGPADRLPMLKTAFGNMLSELKPDDTVAIVTYASGTAVALPPTRVADQATIRNAIDRLHAGGGTYGAGGLQLAYELAAANFDAKGVNRIILGTDGDWNIGISDKDQLKTFIEAKRKSGIYLSILGVGMGNHNDALMQTLAQNGNGVAAYIDTLSEARKVLVDEISLSLFTIAKDVKIQVEFNPAQVAEYRLVGYETRALKREDFANDKVDAGDVGSGHSVTAIYEITPVGSPAVALPELRYQPNPAATTVVKKDASGSLVLEDTNMFKLVGPKKDEYGFLKLRYKLPNEEQSRLLELPISKALEKSELGVASDDVRFSIAVAAYGQLLRGHSNLGMTFDDVIALANASRGPDPFGLRAEFVNLARAAKAARP
jgi:Ca-activated chloride channel homolog